MEKIFRKIEVNKWNVNHYEILWLKYNWRLDECDIEDRENKKGFKRAVGWDKIYDKICYRARKAISDKKIRKREKSISFLKWRIIKIEEIKIKKIILKTKNRLT